MIRHENNITISIKATRFFPFPESGHRRHQADGQERYLKELTTRQRDYSDGKRLTGCHIYHSMNVLGKDLCKDL